MKKLLLLATLLTISCTKNPKKGELWVYCPGKKDNSPFEACRAPIREYKEKVLEVKKGWVKYLEEDGTIRCSTIDYFLIEAHKVK